MYSKFLHYLPREVRDLVYKHVLFFGRVAIEPGDPFDTDKPRLVAYPTVWPYNSLNMSLIRTCKQIFRESRGVFWQYNTLVIDTRLLGTPNFVNTLYSSWEQLRSIELRFGLSKEDVENVRWILQPLEALSRRGKKLQEIRFTISGMGSMQKFGQAVRFDWTPLNGTTTMADIYGFLNKASNPKSGCLAHIKRSLDLRLGMEHASANARKSWLETTPRDQCEATLEKMHVVLGGDLFMDGKLSYRDHVRIRESFNLWDDDGELLITSKLPS